MQQIMIYHHGFERVFGVSVFDSRGVLKKNVG